MAAIDLCIPLMRSSSADQSIDENLPKSDSRGPSVTAVTLSSWRTENEKLRLQTVRI